jgi:hypothetical protein
MNIVISRLGYLSAFTAFFAAAGYCVVQLLQVTGVLGPPLDEILIYAFSLGIPLPFLLALLALHHSISNGKRFWSHAALITGVLYALFAIFVYVVQLGVVIPARGRGAAAGMEVITLTEHSFFWALDAAAYILMGISTLFVSLVFVNDPHRRLIFGFFFANALITPLVALVYFYPEFSTALLLVASPWVITAPGSMLLLARYFKKILDEEKNEVYVERKLYSKKVLTKQ